MCQKAATLGQKFVLSIQFFFLHTKKFVRHTKKSFVLQKNSICTAKIAITHTSSGLGTLSELLVHFLGGMLLS
jgi:hypothetical protein